ncbi:ribose-phosphate pyrophosphokinase [Chitinimonas lacunae]|uniref:ribose-phosphate diphosphokinase n=1 Tax=Chitinimonas lacunae TaxID=1963018 RepID=A0ABV8MP78_9NEIS
MTDALLLVFPGQEALAQALATACGYEWASLQLHWFPDGEVRVTVPANLSGRCVVLLGSLDDPARKTLPLLFAADAARELGACRVGLIAPYLAYLRQDCRFAPGEAISSRTYARILSDSFDFLLTVEPHLHRYRHLDEIYRCEAVALTAAPALADWLRHEVTRPLLVGPDSESEPWTAAVAARLGAPYIVLSKVRQGDRNVSVSLPDVATWRDHTPVLLDDILSTGRTMAAAVARLKQAGLVAPVCVAVHPILAGDALATLEASGAAQVVSSNSIPHPTNRIDLVPLLAEALRGLIGESR